MNFSIGIGGIISYYCIKPVSHAINSHVLTSNNPCINQAIHNFFTLHIHILSQKLTSSTVTCIVLSERNLVRSE